MQMMELSQNNDRSHDGTTLAVQLRPCWEALPSEPGRKKDYQQKLFLMTSAACAYFLGSRVEYPVLCHSLGTRKPIVLQDTMRG